MTTLTISIDRTSLALGPLVLSGTVGGNLGVTAYVEPAMQARIAYAPESPHMPGGQALASTWQQSILGFDFVTDKAADEATSRAQIAEVLQALSQFAYTITVTIGNATPETWKCDTGSMQPTAGRSLTDLANHNPVWQASVPVNPVRSYA